MYILKAVVVAIYPFKERQSRVQLFCEEHGTISCIYAVKNIHIQEGSIISCSVKSIEKMPKILDYTLLHSIHASRYASIQTLAFLLRLFKENLKELQPTKALFHIITLTIKNIEKATTPLILPLFLLLKITQLEGVLSIEHTLSVCNENDYDSISILMTSKNINDILPIKVSSSTHEKIIQHLLNSLEGISH